MDRRLGARSGVGMRAAGFVILHGYCGRAEPDFDLPFPDAVMLFPCARRLGVRSLMPGVPSDVGIQHHSLLAVASDYQTVIER